MQRSSGYAHKETVLLVHELTRKKTFTLFTCMPEKAQGNICLDHLLPESFLYEYPAPFQFHHVSEAQTHQYKYEPEQQPKK